MYFGRTNSENSLVLNAAAAIMSNLENHSFPTKQIILISRQFNQFDQGA